MISKDCMLKHGWRISFCQILIPLGPENALRRDILFWKPDLVNGATRSCQNCRPLLSQEQIRLSWKTPDTSRWFSTVWFCVRAEALNIDLDIVIRLQRDVASIAGELHINRTDNKIHGFISACRQEITINITAHRPRVPKRTYIDLIKRSRLQLQRNRNLSV